MIFDIFHPSFELLLFLAVVISSLFSFVLLTIPSQYDPSKDERGDGSKTGDKSDNGALNQGIKAKPGRSVQIVVLGDIGRSPRMQYHAISIAKHGGTVQLIGYEESEIHPEVLSNPLIRIVGIKPNPPFLQSSSKLLFPFCAPLKALWQAWSLYNALGYRTDAARWMLIQNPPSIPTIAIAEVVCFIRNTKLVIDWHNFGYSILALKLGPNHPLVKISAFYEKALARFASAHFTVTDAMARVLNDEYNVTALALHDRPAALFKPLSPAERNQFLVRLPETAQYAAELLPSSNSPWRLIVSSTSWTPDEDFSILLGALSAYSSECVRNTRLPKILAIITGKGPLKDYYLSKIQAMNQEKKLLNVVIRTAWLTPEDYALLLGSADLGVSLHTSSSGVDLPMKVVDMFGAGLPVVGWGKFAAWPELVKEDVNGKGFQNSEELFHLFVDLFGKKHALLEKLKRGALTESGHRWDDEWNRVGRKLLEL